jgi:hypothetical protein
VVEAVDIELDEDKNVPPAQAPDLHPETGSRTE